MDLERIQELLRLMELHALAEIEVESSGEKVRLRKAEAQLQAAPALASTREPAAAQTFAAEGATDDGYAIVSPIVGTFYRAPSPDTEPFVEGGDPVEPDTVVCIVEAMKVMNEVKAGVTGSIRKVLVENGKPVEYGQALFLVAR